ncbi:hypothetical protein ACVGVM_18215 [Pseudonocardia bannensis]|uniref:Uncharacterized protein n=1 Tax=Pseudonocardia bannensis TaxID=630973 RepID=A0A848DM85_9PSEU|nr:hypothetical protein [Pseudonocardia bannensis]NMH93665.1 hypothetical protein [Pseudonocardia bannensis]
MTEPHTPDGPAASTSPGPMAGVLADMPEVWRRLLVEHVPDRLGRCTACRNVSGSGVRWPCTLQQIASQARVLHETRGDG